ncbi:hypothetical protein F383_30784 [Gossypium arboreum]|uniref:Uncharacterized protein n=1 Tax=Gossypium arboreum TaxID=29729 RepID=A0A0B0PI07_GOSAR|nr:hypothetical protein F383_30784 [Gossypium arboreum]
MLPRSTEGSRSARKITEQPLASMSRRKSRCGWIAQTAVVVVEPIETALREMTVSAAYLALHLRTKATLTRARR